MATEHLYHCTNKRCKQRGQTKRAAHSRGALCSACGKNMEYDGEQMVLPFELSERLAQLEQRVQALEQANPEAHMTDECRAHQCDYFKHYLAYGPAELTHEGYHAAVLHCEKAQKRIDDWMNAHPKGKVPETLMRMAQTWETRVRA